MRGTSYFNGVGSLKLNKQKTKNKEQRTKNKENKDQNK